MAKANRDVDDNEEPSISNQYSYMFRELINEITWDDENRRITITFCDRAVAQIRGGSNRFELAPSTTQATR
jgi:hypothetical protein